MAKYEWKVAEKVLYGSGEQPVEVDVPALGFFTLEGRGSPDAPEFQEKVEALYALSYAVRMAHKTPSPPEGWYEYTVYPLEGVWDLGGKSAEEQVAAKREKRPPAPFDKNDLIYTLMIRQPSFVTPEYAQTMLEATRERKKLPTLTSARFEVRTEGRCVQMLHKGPFTDEPASFKKMLDFCRKESLARVGHQHREIYLSDPRKTTGEKLRTILRFPVRDNFACL